MLIKKWRNDQISVLRQDRVLTDEDQDNYYQNIVLPAMAAVKPSIILFSYLVDGACIGYGGLTNIDWTSKKGEISFLLDSVRISDAERYRLDFGVFLKLIERIAFEEVHLNRLFTETFDIRPLHIDILENNGFRLEGRLRQNVFIEGRFADSLIHGYLREDYERGRGR